VNAQETHADLVARLEAVALKMMAQSPSVAVAAAQLEHILVNDRPLMRALLREYIGEIAEKSSRGGGQHDGGARYSIAPAARPVGDGEGLSAHDAQTTCTPSSPSSEDRPAARSVAPNVHMPAGSSPPDAAAGQPRRDAHTSGAPAASPVHDRSGRKACAFQTGRARPVVKPKPSFRTLAVSSRVEHVARRTIIDTFKVRDGRALGDLLWRELTVLARENEAEGRVLRAIAGHVANADPEAKVRTIVKAETVDAIVKEARRGA